MGLPGIASSLSAAWTGEATALAEMFRENGDEDCQKKCLHSGKCRLSRSRLS